MTLLRQPRKYEAVMGEFLKTSNNADTADSRTQVHVTHTHVCRVVSPGPQRITPVSY